MPRATCNPNAASIYLDERLVCQAASVCRCSDGNAKCSAFFIQKLDHGCAAQWLVTFEADINGQPLFCQPNKVAFREGELDRQVAEVWRQPGGELQVVIATIDDVEPGSAGHVQRHLQLMQHCGVIHAAGIPTQIPSPLRPLIPSKSQACMDNCSTTLPPIARCVVVVANTQYDVTAIYESCRSQIKKKLQELTAGSTHSATSERSAEATSQRQQGAVAGKG